MGILPHVPAHAKQSRMHCTHLDCRKMERNVLDEPIERRWVQTPDGLYDPEAVPPEWYQWLRKRRSAAPSMQEVQQYALSQQLDTHAHDWSTCAPMASRSAIDAGLPEKGHLLCLVLQDGIPQSANTAESCCLGCSRTAEALSGQLCKHKYAMMQPHKLVQIHRLPACIMVAQQPAPDEARLVSEAWLHVQILFSLLCSLLALHMLCHLCITGCKAHTRTKAFVLQAATTGDREASEAQGPNMQRFVQQLSGKVWHSGLMPK